MPITIKELLSSDTISQAVDKINYNFDQLLLNGGGPVGPIGTQGKSGPSGGRGLRGTKWYEDPTAFPGSDPNTLILTDVNENDSFLQANGKVWNYNGSAWVLTLVDIRGPEGPSNAFGEFSYFGGFPGMASIDNENVIYPSPMPSGISAGGDQATNEAIPSILLGGVASNTPEPSGITYTSAFKISDTLAKSLDSSVLTLLVHQKNSSSSAIRLMGGGATASDNYEQSDLTKLSEISVGIDDTLNLQQHKQATGPTSQSDLIGINLNAFYRGIQIRAGKHLSLITGTDSTATALGSNEISDLTITLNTSNSSKPAKFSVNSTDTSADVTFEVGGSITIPSTTTKTGKILGLGDDIRFVAKTTAGLQTNTNNIIKAEALGLTAFSSIGRISLQTSGTNDINVTSGRNFSLSSANTFSLTGAQGGTISAGGNGYLNIQSNQTTLGEYPYGLIATSHRIRIDNTSSTSGGSKFIGNVTWGIGSNGYVEPQTTTHKQILISKKSLTTEQSPVMIFSPNKPYTTPTLGLSVLQGSSASNPTSQVKIYGTGINIDDITNSSGFTGFKLSAKDSISNNTGTRFHANRDVTEIHNRLQFVQKRLVINPLTEGITEDAGYAIPESFMDCSYLDIFIGYNGGPISAFIDRSDDTFDINIPDGLYKGQKLIIHLVVAPTAYSDGTRTYSWPLNSTSGDIKFGTINLNVDTLFTGAADNKLAQAICSAPNAAPRYAGEAYVELTWIGTEYGAYIYPTLITGTRGWAVTNISTSEISFSNTLSLE